MKPDRPAVGHDRPDVLTADETKAGVVEIVATEIVDHRAVRAGRHERVDIDAFIHEDCGAAGGLVGIVAADHSLS